MGLIINPYFFAAATPEVTDLLLNNIPYSSGAFALRKLDKNYTGSCIKVRQDSGSGTLLADIGFDSNGDLDTVALLAHTGSANGYIHTWYDQSGLGYNATQTTDGSQPRIVNSGTVDTKNSEPAILLDGTGFFDISIPNTTNFVGLMVSSKDQSGGYIGPSLSGPGVSRSYIMLHLTNQRYYTKNSLGAYVYSDAVYDSDQHLLVGQGVETPTIYQYKDGNVITGVSTTGGGIASFGYIGKDYNTIQRGYLQEIIYYDEDRYPELTRLMSNVGAKYRGWSDYSLFSTEFDGVNDYVDLGNILNLTSAITISAWIKPATNVSSQTYPMFVAKDLNVAYMLYGNNTGTLRLRIGTNTAANVVDSTTTLLANTWYHIVGTYDGTNMKVYVNGSLETTKARSGSIPTTSNSLQIAIANDTNNPFNGKIDEVSIFSSALTSGNVTTIYNSGVPADLTDLSPTAWWRMGDESGAPYLTNKMAYSKYSMDFDGVDDYVTMGNVLAYERTDSFSISAWIKTSTVSGDDAIVAKQGSVYPYRGYMFYRSSGKLGVFFDSDGFSNKFTVNTTSTVLTVDTWHHVVMTYDGTSGTGGGISIYVDGASVAVTTDSTSLTSTIIDTTTFAIGGRGNGGNSLLPWTGQIDDVSIFDSELSAPNVTTIYNNGTPNDISSLSPVGYWKMGEGAIFPQIPNEMAYSKQSLDFDGVDDYVDIGSPSTGTGTHTISMWVNPTSIVNNDRLISNIDNTDFSIRFFLGNVQAWGTGTSWKNLFSNPSTSVWTHMAFVFDGSGNVTGYKNGVQGLTDTVNYTFSQLGLGAIAGLLYGDVYHGKMDEVAIWNTALSSANITTIYNNGAPNDISSLSPVGWWKMGDGDYFPTMTDSGSGSNNGTATNMSGADVELDTPNGWGTSTNMLAADIEGDTANGNGGTMTNMGQADIVQDTQKYSNLSVDFDGVSDYVTMGNVLDQDNTDAFSVSAWIKLSSVGTTHKVIVSKMDETSNFRGWNIRSYNGTLKISFSNIAGSNELQFTSTSTVFTVDTWHHVVMTYDGSSASSGVTAYVDNSTVSGSWSGTLSGTLANSASFDISSRNNGSLPFNGNIDEVSFFDSELTLENVRTIYNNGRPTDISSLSPVAWWRMGELSTYPTIIDDGSGSNNGTMTNMTAGDIENETP